MKTCKRCSTELTVDTQIIRSDTGSIRPHCKTCQSILNKEARSKDPEKYKARCRAYYIKTKNKAIQKANAYIQKYPEKHKQYQKTWRNSEKGRQSATKRYNSESYKQYKKSKRCAELRRIRERSKEHKAKLRLKEQTDILYKLSKRLRSRLGTAIYRKSLKKTSKLREYLGCTIAYLKSHLESKFQPGMTWANYGKWHIDHIIPLATATTAEEMCKLCHYTNLQPLWAEDNLKKGSKQILEKPLG